MLGKAPIDEKTNKPLHAYDKDGKPFENCFNVDGEPKRGTDEFGRPIVGIDKSNGKPITPNDD